MEMLDENTKKRLEKQQYRVVGSHSTVKVCGWTKNMIKGEGGCYKLKFYGIMSHQCLQMTSSMSCANRCIFCWRDYKAPVSKEWKWDVDEPEFIIEGSLKAQKKLLEGFGGNPKANKTAFEASKNVKHVALSLSGEPIIYPRINELIKRFHERGISTFLVTNGQHPEQIEKLDPVTQLYLSLDAPTKELLKEIDKPLFQDFWIRLEKSLKALAEKKQRTTIRITIMKDYNDDMLDRYAELIKLGNPEFIEVKGYMHVGASQERLERKHMPFHEYILKISKKLSEFLPEYEILSEHIPSRVVLLAKKSLKKDTGWATWIDFKKFEALTKEFYENGKEFSTEDYLRKTPINLLGIKSETGIKDEIIDADNKEYLKVSEHNSEIDLE